MPARRLALIATPVRLRPFVRSARLGTLGQLAQCAASATISLQEPAFRAKISIPIAINALMELHVEFVH